MRRIIVSAPSGLTKWRLFLLCVYCFFWAGMVRKLPDIIYPETPCEAACRHDPRKVVLSAEASTARRLLADPSFVEISGPVSQRKSWSLCAWAAPALMTPYYNSVDESDTKHQSSLVLLDLLAELEARTGAVTVARSGAALGVYRDQRRTSCDSDLDVWIVVPDGKVEDTMDTLRSMSQARPDLYEWNNIQTFSRIYYDPRMMIGRIRYLPDRNKIDFEIVTESFVQDPLLDEAFLARCNVSMKRLFTHLCRCRFGNRTTLAAFSDMPPYLTAMYGHDFEMPILAHYDQRCTIQVHYPRAFFRWWPMRWIRSWFELHPAFDLVDPLDLA